MNEIRPTVTVLGAGSSGMSTAAYLTLAGCQVTLCDTPAQAEDFSVIRQQGGILLKGGSGKTGLAMPYKLTNDFKEALLSSKCVIVCVSAGRQEEIAKIVAPLAQPGQVFLLSPGNFGSFIFRRHLDEQGKTAVAAAELSGNLWACRRHVPGEVLVAMPLKEGTIAALPAKDTDRVIQAFSGILSLKAGKNVLEVSLNSPNVISHVAGAVLNATQIEQKKDAFAFFQDGLGDHVINCFIGLEKERKAVMEYLGLSVYNASSEGLMRTLMDPACPGKLHIFRALDGPSSFTHRYVSEDAACGVAMIVSLGEQYQIPTPLTKAFLTIAQHINQTDYMKTGCTLENLGLAGLAGAELISKLA